MVANVPSGVCAIDGKPCDEMETAENRGVEVLRHVIVEKLIYAVGKDPNTAKDHDWFLATALAVRDRIVDLWAETEQTNCVKERKRVYYLSLEFLIGRLLFDTLNNLGLTETVRQALAEVNVDLERLRGMEPDAALGNGGLGRLAACFMESMASLSIAAYGYGIRYNHGLFRQVIENGWQHEVPEDWLSLGNPWEFRRPEATYTVGFGGTVETTHTEGSDVRAVWIPAETVNAVAYDMPVVGWRAQHVNALRLWSSCAPEPLHLETFNRGDHVRAAEARVRAEAISQVLYPSDDTPAGAELRLRQEYFFASASIQDLLRRHIAEHGSLRSLPDFAAIQLNDTHPAIAVAELMRLLVDEHRMAWDAAWELTTRTFSYTNHTLLPEALEKWPVVLMERLLPRHMQIIYLINALHLDGLRASGRASDEQIATVSLIDEVNGRCVRMGALSFLGSHKVNGVSALHTELMRQTVFRDFHALYPDRIVNKTNGITFRRWFLGANPELARLAVDVAGSQVLDDPQALEVLAAHAGDSALHDRFAAIRRNHKSALAKLVGARMGVEIDPDALFDVQIKRIHEYKRQLLNILETVALYNAMRADPAHDWTPRVRIFAGKAAASYRQAKLIIKLINDVAQVVNNDPALAGRLKIVFLPNYNVSLAEAIIPAADLSEQISTAGMEASGTGNMKLALNGALTIGTLDGANIEILERVGRDNIFIFGLTADEVEARHRAGMDAGETIAKVPSLRQALADIRMGRFSPSEPTLYHELVDALVRNDHFMVTADFEAYSQAQRLVGERWADPAAWWRSSILNTAHIGWFASDRTIREYAKEIWKVPVGHDA